MLKYIIASGIALSFFYLLSELFLNVLSNMLKTKKELGISLTTQIVNKKNRQG